MKSIKQQLGLLSLIFFITLTTIGQNLEATLDPILEAAYPADQPGASVLIAKNGKAIYRKAFGMANLELGVPMKPENVFEIGSVTKQFTSVSILMLMEQGKLTLQDDITKFLPDYPTHGHKISVHQLLNHTSGIKSYTNMRSFMSRAREDMSPTELIDVFKNEPMDFDPGEQYRYNNSAYIILGHIIEVASGMSYEDYIEKNIFEKLGMKNSFYGSHTQIIKNRANGYQPSENGYNNAEYLSMTLPYAGGSLMSCVDDMLKWQQAIHKNTLISEKSKQLAFANYKLNDGSNINYGYGFSIDEINGIPTIEHGGGIFGYTCYAIYEPKEDMYAIILTNSNGNPSTGMTIEIMAHALGKPFPKTSAVSLTDAQLQQWVGTYAYDGDVLRFVTFKDGSLYSQREGSTVMKLIPISEDQFYFDGSTTQYQFSKKNGKKVALFKDRINEAIGTESNKKPAAEKEGIKVATNILKSYEGTYELQPGFSLVITTDGNQIFGQATGQPKAELFAETENIFFLKVVAAKVVFNRDDKGVVESLTLQQGGQEMKGMKTE